MGEQIVSVVEQIQRRKLSQQVTERLMDLIGSGKIAPGEQLPSERDLMERYGVGRPAVREAMQALERAGVITITHGERARVAVPTADSLIAQIATGAQHLLRTRPGSLEHLKEARLFLETGLARLAALRAEPQGLAELAARLEEHRHATERLEEFAGRDIAFHRQIAVMTGNPIFAATLEAMLKWLSAYYRALVRAPGAESLTLDEHQRIYDAIAARDPAAAEAAMRDHLTRANTLYRSLVTPEPDATQ
jgi:DNA-binding FadR family transcriptional regulator